jgi:hypothetical protein
MKKMRISLLAILLVAGLGSTVRAGSKDRAVIVMPVRYTVVQFAFDVARIRPVELLAYDKGASDEPLLLHVWDAAGSNWKPAEVAAYRDGSLFARTPKRVFLVGGEADLPAELAAAPAWAKDVTPIPSLKVLDMANTMNRKLKFSNREWKKLAKRHNLELIDDNAERRRYGRYGKPGTKYSGPRPVNPLVARFRSLKKDKPDMEEAVEEAVEVAPVETDEADEATEAPADVPEAEGKAEALVTGMIDDPSEGDVAPAVEADIAPDEK